MCMIHRLTLKTLHVADPFVDIEDTYMCLIHWLALKTLHVADPFVDIEDTTCV